MLLRAAKHCRPRKAGRHKERCFPGKLPTGASERASSCCWDFMWSGIRREWISIILSHYFCGNLLEQPWETIISIYLNSMFNSQTHIISSSIGIWFNDHSFLLIHFPHLAFRTLYFLVFLLSQGALPSFFNWFLFFSLLKKESDMDFSAHSNCTFPVAQGKILASSLMP